MTTSATTLDKVRVVLTSFVTWLSLISSVLVFAADEIARQFADDPTARTVIAVIISIVVFLVTVINIIRHVVKVLPSQVGLTLPPNAPTVVPIFPNHTPL